MTRRQVHSWLAIGGLIIAGGAVVVGAPMDWLNRSDLFFAGTLVVALGLHGLWKTDPR